MTTEIQPTARFIAHTHLVLPPDLKAAIQRLAKTNKRSMNAEVAIALERYIVTLGAREG